MEHTRNSSDNKSNVNNSNNSNDNEGAPKLVADLVDAGSVVMLMTMVGGSHSSRPVTVADASGNELWFLADRTSEWVAAIQNGLATTHVTLSDRGDNRYLALNGDGAVSTDRATLERLWTPIASTWFSGVDDPRLVAVRFEATDGEYWEGPGTVVGKTVAMLRSMLSGNDRAMGDHGAIQSQAPAR